MNALLKWRLVMAVLFVAVFALSPSFARASGAPPYVVRFTGTLCPLDGNTPPQTGMSKFLVFINHKEWLFTPENVEQVANSKPYSEILNNVFPPILYFRGPRNVIESLQNPEIEGYLINLEGFLYPGDRIFSVMRMTPTTEKTTASCLVAGK